MHLDFKCKTCRETIYLEADNDIYTEQGCSKCGTITRVKVELKPLPASQDTNSKIGNLYLQSYGIKR